MAAFLLGKVFDLYFYNLLSQILFFSPDRSCYSDDVVLYIDAIDVTRVTLSRLNCMNAIDFTRVECLLSNDECQLSYVICQMSIRLNLLSERGNFFVLTVLFVFSVGEVFDFNFYILKFFFVVTAFFFFSSFSSVRYLISFSNMLPDFQASTAMLPLLEKGLLNIQYSCFSWLIS